MRVAIAWCAAIAFGVTTAASHAADDVVSFVRDVKPLLARRCFSCHGPTAREGGLRLDRPETALAEIDSGLHAIVPGHVEQSALIERVSATDETSRMPPEGKPLTSKEIATLKEWIAAGAKWEKHWAFVPPQRHVLPVVAKKSWAQNPIDAFILARLDRSNLEPAPPADKRSLARRAYFGVTGNWKRF
jgi:mono/diheme cytochrome c family protein